MAQFFKMCFFVAAAFVAMSVPAMAQEAAPAAGGGKALINLTGAAGAGIVFVFVALAG